MTEPIYAYNPLERRTYEAIAYNAIGRASEVGTYPAYGLVHSTGNSGWSVGVVQWDFGQPNRGQKVETMLDGYQAWAQPDRRFTEQEIDSLSRRLQTRGQVGNALTADEQSRLNGYLRSDAGREFVDSLNSEQIDRKWTNVGEPLSQIPWLQRLSERDPQQAAEIVALTSKLYNQNENRGGRLLAHLQQNEVTSDQTYAWIGNEGVLGLNPAARTAILSGRDGALSGIRLMNQLEVGDGQLSRLWRDEVHANGNVGLTQNFNTNPTVQLFDAMMRNPEAGERIRANIDEQASVRPAVIQGINALAREEIARTESNRESELTVRGPDGTERRLTPNGWISTQELQQEAPRPQPRRIDQQDHLEPGRMPGRAQGHGVLDHEKGAIRSGLAQAIERLTPQERDVYDRGYAAVQARGGYDDEQTRNIAAAGVLAFNQSRSTMVAHDVGVYDDRLRTTYMPYGPDKQPNFPVDVKLADAAQIPTERSLQQSEDLAQRRMQEQMQQQDAIAQGQSQGGPSIGPRVA